jgi:hypothetical protein
MSYIVVCVDNNLEERNETEELFGRFNDFPPGWKEITPEEFAHSSVARNVPARIEYRQMIARSAINPMSHNGPMTEAVLNHMGKGSGYAIVTDYWKKTVQYFTFDCFPKLKEIFDSIPKVSDSGWSMDERSSRPMRGIRDYKRTIEFNNRPTDKEFKRIVTYLERDNCPGWTGVGCMKTDNEKKFIFYTTWDSSD